MVSLKSFLVAFTATLLPVASQAERLFYNEGTLDGWDGSPREEHNGKVEERDNIFFSPPTSLKMLQIYDPNYDGRYHSEVDVSDGYTRHDERFYGFAFRLSEDWEFTSQGYNIAQFIANREGAGCDGDDWMPSSMIWLKGDQLTTRIVSGSYREPDCSRKITPFENLATVTPGDWHTIVLQVRWKSDESGEYKMWFDGERVLEETDVATTVNDDETFQFRVGLYANSWYDDGGMEGNQPERQIWYDEIAIGTTFADVDSQE